MTTKTILLGVFAAIVLIAPAARCGSSPGRVPATPAPPGIPYSLLAGRMAHAAFSVTYAGDVGGSRGDLLWRQDGARTRWDLFYHQLDDIPAVSSAAQNGAIPAGACAVYFASPSEASLTCLSKGVDVEFYDTLVSPFELLGPSLRSVGSDEIAGQLTSCFQDEVAAIQAFAKICLTDDGLPLSFDVIFGLNTASVRAVSVNPAPLAGGDDLLRLPWPSLTGLNLLKVSTSELSLPPIDALQAYVRSG